MLEFIRQKLKLLKQKIKDLVSIEPPVINEHSFPKVEKPLIDNRTREFIIQDSTKNGYSVMEMAEAHPDPFLNKPVTKHQSLNPDFEQYFRFEEFDCPTIPNSGHDYMDTQFLNFLTKARNFSSVPFRITSGYRSKEHNQKVGGLEDSAHLKGLAADIAVPTSRDRCIIINALLKVGFRRIGIGKNFIHVDLDITKPQESIWLYD